MWQENKERVVPRGSRQQQMAMEIFWFRGKEGCWLLGFAEWREQHIRGEDSVQGVEKQLGEKKEKILIGLILYKFLKITPIDKKWKSSEK